MLRLVFWKLRVVSWFGYRECLSVVHLLLGLVSVYLERVGGEKVEGGG